MCRNFLPVQSSLKSKHTPLTQPIIAPLVLFPLMASAEIDHECQNGQMPLLAASVGGDKDATRRVSHGHFNISCAESAGLARHACE